MVLGKLYWIVIFVFAQCVRCMALEMSDDIQIVPSAFNSKTSAQVCGGAVSRGMYTINRAGRYFIVTDVFAAPGSDNIPLIHINSSDVILDLGGKTLTLSTTLAGTRTCRAAIEIAPGKRNIMISNGTINGMAGSTQRILYGIVNQAEGSEISTNIVIEHVNIVGCKQASIMLRNINMLNINSVQAFGSPDGVSESIHGLHLTNCQQGRIINTIFNGGYSTGADSVCGLCATDCCNFKVINVNFSNQIAQNASAHGMELVRCRGFWCKDVRSCHNEANTASGEVVGLLLDASSANIFDECKFCENKNGSTEYKARHPGNDAVPTAGCSYGVKVCNESNSNNFIKCEVAENQCSMTGAGSYVAGFACLDSSYNFFSQCVSVNNEHTASAADSVYSYGFYSQGCRGNIFKECRAIGNCVASTKSKAAAHGLCLCNDIASQVSLSEFNGNRTCGAASCAYGIRLSGNCSYCVISGNRIFANFSENYTKQYGFIDEAANTTTFLRGNIAFGQGNVFNKSGILVDTGKMNYNLQFSSTQKQTKLISLLKREI